MTAPLAQNTSALNRESAGLYRQIADIWRNKILTGEYKPGDQLPTERDIAESLGVSRIPVREAFKSLEYLGVIKQIRGKGVFVQKVDLNQLVMQCGPLCVEQDQQTMKDLFEYRIFTECYAASEAAKRATKEQIEKLRLSNQTMSELLGNQEEMEHISLDFHNLIVQIADNTILSLVTAFLTQILKQSRHKTLWDEKRHEESCHYHKLILSAIEAHDPEKASLYMRKHLEMARDRLIAHMQQE